MMRGISTGLVVKSFLGVITGVALFMLPAISAPIAGPKGILPVPLDNSQLVQVRAVRGGYRGGSCTEAPQFTEEPPSIAAER